MISGLYFGISAVLRRKFDNSKRREDSIWKKHTDHILKIAKGCQLMIEI